MRGLGLVIGVRIAAGGDLADDISWPTAIKSFLNKHFMGLLFQKINREGHTSYRARPMGRLVAIAVPFTAAALGLATRTKAGSFLAVCVMMASTIVVVIEVGIVLVYRIRRRGDHPTIKHISPPLKKK